MRHAFVARASGVALPTSSVRSVRLLGAVFVSLVMASGCGRPGGDGVGPSTSPPAVPRPVARVSRDKILESALAVLDRLDDFDEARGAELVFDRINQWARLAPTDAVAAWRQDPLADTLSARLRGELTEIVPDANGFAMGDVVFLRDQRWLADIARVARGEARDDLEVALALFEWTVRSLALVGDPPTAPTATNPGTRWCLPGEILLAGRASGPQRAWIFLQLLRHAGLDGVMLGLGGGAEQAPRSWLPAVLVEDELHLFEPVYAMPVPGPEGSAVATLRQAATDPAILAGLSLPDRPYPVQAADLAAVTVLVAADPLSLSRRMVVLDPDVRGAREMRVAVDGSRLAAAANAAVEAAGITPAPPALWEFPWETLARRRSEATRVAEAVQQELAPLQVPFVPQAGTDRPELLRPLLTARLREFRGELDGPQGAKAAYLAARAGRAAVASAVAGLPAAQAEAARTLFTRMKEDAAYWLGILTLAEGEYDAAIDYLGRMTVEGSPDSRWTDAARTNLARALIAVGRTGEAAVALREDLSPQRFGSRVLADRLERTVATGKPVVEPGTPAAPAPNE